MMARRPGGSSMALVMAGGMLLFLASLLPAVSHAAPATLDACTALAADPPADAGAGTNTRDAAGIRVLAARHERVAGREVCAIEGRATARLTFRLLLPREQWSGRYVQLACDADCRVPLATLCDEPVQRGHACLSRTTARDAVPPPAGATHELVTAAQAAIQRYYGKAAERRFFLGCGIGGSEALRAAQQHPGDFHGILAGAPLLEPAARARTLRWNLDAARGHPGLGPDDLPRLHRAAIARCDADDGLVDGLIGDPLRCRFDPRTLACDGTDAANCLSAAAIAAAAKLYAGPPNPGDAAAGTAGLLPGSELEWAAFLGAQGAALARRVVTDGSAVDAAASDPDLAAFAAAGGKLILYHGLADAQVSPRRTIRWFEALARQRGGLVATQATVRLFAVPGMAHCGGGEGASRIDFLAALETWSGSGSIRPPDDVIAFRPASVTQRVHPFAPAARDQWATLLSRPVFAYPLPVRYKGRGDPAHWMSFYAPAEYSLQSDGSATE
jgi:feruloyl esterase